MRMLIASLVVFLFGCQTHMPVKTASTSPNRATIRPGMFLHVTVEHEPALTGFYLVSEAGSIPFMFWRLAVAGRTREEVADEIKSRIEKDYVREAVVFVEIVDKENVLGKPFAF
jgi:protein involved in polysaccharide export with SLBB domain